MPKKRATTPHRYPAPKQGTGFVQLAEWASDPAAVFDAQLARVLDRSYVQEEVKKRVLILLMKRQRLAELSKIAERLGSVETSLFNDVRVNQMEDKNLIALYNALSNRQIKLQAAVEGTDRPITVEIDDFKMLVQQGAGYVNATPMPEIPADSAKRISDAVEKVASMAIYHELGKVPPPPTIT